METLLIGAVVVFLLNRFLKDADETPEKLFLDRKEIINKVIQYQNFVIIFAKQHSFKGKESYILAMIAQESAGDPQAKGSIGEVGLMQITRGALQDVNDLRINKIQFDDLEKPVPNINVGVSYLDIQKKRMNGDLFRAIQAYNAGAAAVKKNDRAGSDYLQRVLDWRTEFISYDK